MEFTWRGTIVHPPPPKLSWAKIAHYSTLSISKARKKVIIAPLIWISQLFGSDGSKSTLVFKIFWTLIGILLQKYFQPIVRNANAKLMQTGNIVVNRSVHFMLNQFFKYYACYCSEFSKGLVNLISCATSHCH